MRTLPSFRLLVSAVAALGIMGCSAESKKASALARADKYYKAAEYEKARIEYQNVLQKDPENAEALERLGLIWSERGSSMRALFFMLKVKAAAPGNLEIRLKAAKILLALGKTADARKEALTILGRSSGYADAIVVVTEAIRGPQDYKEAEEEWRKLDDKNTVPAQIATANLSLLRGDAPAAIAALQRGLARDPKSPAAHLAMAELYVLQNNRAQAMTEFKTAAELSPVRSIGRLRYAGFLAQTGAVSEAVAYLNDITRQAPDYMSAWRSLAQIAMAQRKNDEALGFLQKVSAVDPVDYEGQILRARITLAKGDVKKAIEEFERIGRDFPGIAIEKHQLALAHLQNHDQEKALGALQDALVQNPDNVEALLLWAQLNLRAGTAQPVAAAMAELFNKRPNLMQAYPLFIESMRVLNRLDDVVRVIGENLKNAPRNPQLHYLLGLVLIQQQKPAEARASFERALEASPDLLPAISELVYLDLRERKSAAAMKRVRALQEKAPALATSYFMEARIHAADGKWNDVETAVIKTLERDRAYPGAYNVLAESFLARKNQPDLGTHLEDFLAKRPNDEIAAMIGGQVYTEMKQFAKARATLEKLLVTQPESVLVLNNLANLLAEHLNELDRALQAARKARGIEPASPLIADTLGWILYKRKEYPEAWTLLQESVGKMPENVEIQYHYGMASRMLEKNEVALAAFRIAAKGTANFPGKDEAKRQLAQLEQSLPTPPAAPAEKPAAK